MELRSTEIEGAGLLLIYKQGAEFRAEVIGADGEARPEWAEPVLEAVGTARGATAERWGIGAGWAEGVRALAARGSGEGDLIARRVLPRLGGLPGAVLSVRGFVRRPGSGSGLHFVRRPRSRRPR